MKIVLHKEAKEQGLTRYFTGKPCKRGHIAERLASNRMCVVCGRVKIHARHKLRYGVELTFRVKKLTTTRMCKIKRRNDPEYRAMDNARIIARKAERRRIDPLFLMKKRIKNRVQFSLKNGGFTKKSTMIEILGCDWDVFYHHIESQFVGEMSWENRHLWHIDHKTPLATAKTEEDVVRLNHYTNLQPLWAEDNLRKGSKTAVD